MSIPPAPKFEPDDIEYVGGEQEWRWRGSVGIPPPVKMEIKLTPEGERLLDEMSGLLSKKIEEEVGLDFDNLMTGNNVNTSKQVTIEEIRQVTDGIRKEVEEFKKKEAEVFLSVAMGGYRIIPIPYFRSGQIGVCPELYEAIRKAASESQPREVL